MSPRSFQVPGDLFRYLRHEPLSLAFRTDLTSDAGPPLMQKALELVHHRVDGTFFRFEGFHLHSHLTVILR